MDIYIKKYSYKSKQVLADVSLSTPHSVKFSPDKVLPSMELKWTLDCGREVEVTLYEPDARRLQHLIKDFLSK